MALLDFITKPLRGIGRMVGGVLDLNPKRFGRGLADVGSTAKSLAPALGLTGVGLPLAAIIGGAGGLAEAASPEYRGDVGDVVGGMASGAAGGAAGALARGPLGIGRAAAGAAPAAATAAPAAATSIPGGAMGFGIPSATVPLPAPAATALAPTAAGTGATSMLSTSLKGPAPRGIGRQILAWAQKNPEIAIGVLQTGAQLYSSEQEGEARDRELALREEQARRNVRAGGLGVRQPYEEWNRLRGRYGYGGGG